MKVILYMMNRKMMGRKIMCDHSMTKMKKDSTRAIKTAMALPTTVVAAVATANNKPTISDNEEIQTHSKQEVFHTTMEEADQHIDDNSVDEPIII